MKLINYLLSESRKGWKWPNNVVKAVVMEGDRGVNFYFDYTCPPSLSETLISPHPFTSTEVVTSQQYEAALAASKTEWDGEGLPPVGCRVEASYGGEWVEATVAYTDRPESHGDAVAWKEVLVFDCKTTRPFWADEFRPIRSEADKKRDAAAEAIDYWMPALPPTQNKFYHAKKLYDAIAAGKIPHIRID